MSGETHLEPPKLQQNLPKLQPLPTLKPSIPSDNEASLKACTSPQLNPNTKACALEPVAFGFVIGNACRVMRQMLEADCLGS